MFRDVCDITGPKHAPFLNLVAQLVEDGVLLGCEVLAVPSGDDVALIVVIVVLGTYGDRETTLCHLWRKYSLFCAINAVKTLRYYCACKYKQLKLRTSPLSTNQHMVPTDSLFLALSSFLKRTSLALYLRGRDTDSGNV